MPAGAIARKATYHAGPREGPVLRLTLAWAAKVTLSSRYEVTMYGRLALVVVGWLFLGCGDSDSGPPVDFTGLYAGTSTNGASDCPGTWTTGATADGEANLVQSGSDVTFQMQGGTALAFLVAFGSASFSGKAIGSHVDAAIVGSVPAMTGACSYTWKGTLAGDLKGDTLNGTLTYTPNITMPHADCDTMKVTGCSRVASFAYTRPMK